MSSSVRSGGPINAVSTMPCLLPPQSIDNSKERGAVDKVSRLLWRSFKLCADGTGAGVEETVELMGEGWCPKSGQKPRHEPAVVGSAPVYWGSSQPFKHGTFSIAPQALDITPAPLELPDQQQ